MKLETEQLIGTLELLNEPLDGYDENIGGSYTAFHWDVSTKGKFNLWNLMNDEKHIQPISPQTAISQWILDEWLHPIATDNDTYPPDHPKDGNFLNPQIKIESYKIYKALYELLNSSLDKLKAFKVNIDINKKLDYLCFLVGKTNNNSWLVISPSVGRRKKIPHWISHSDFEEYTDNSKSISELQSTVEKLLGKLSPLKLCACYRDGHGYIFNYYYSYAFAKTKAEAFSQVFKIAKILQIKRFISFSSDYYQSFYNDDKRRKTIYGLNNFIKQNLLNTNLYHFTMCDNDYTYILGETSDKDWLGVKISRSYRYFR